MRLLGFYDWLVPESTRRSLLVLLGAVALVLLIACGNVVNLLLARGTGRQRELSIRTAMGATRARVARQLLFESCLIAVLAAGIGVAISFAVVRLLVALGPESVPRLDEISIDSTVLAFALGVALTTMIAFGLCRDPSGAAGSAGRPARRLARLHLGHRKPADSCGADGRRSGALGRPVDRRRAADRSFARLQQVNPGFNTSGVMTARVGLPNTAYPGGPPKRAFFERLLTDLRGRPGIEAAAIASGRRFRATSRRRRQAATQSNEEAGSAAWRLAGPDISRPWAFRCVDASSRRRT